MAPKRSQPALIKKAALRLNPMVDEALGRIAFAWNEPKETVVNQIVAYADYLQSYLLQDPKKPQMPNEWGLFMERDNRFMRLRPFEPAEQAPRPIVTRHQALALPRHIPSAPLVVRYTQASHDMLKRVAEKYVTSDGDGLSRAIELVDFLLQKEKEGWNIYLRRKNEEPLFLTPILPVAPRLSAASAVSSPLLH